MDGILNINKPKGITSFGVVSVVRRLTKEKRVGHAGTLDPLATGVLPVCLGQATRVVEYMADSVKAYRGEIEFGIVTDTYDSEGAIIRQGDITGISKTKIKEALTSFHGEIMQIPPIYSALKQQGTPLYELARAGASVEVKSRSVIIHQAKLLKWEPPIATVDITCGKGTYIRSIAYDMGEALGCGAYLKNLVRIQYGVFNISDAVHLADFEAASRTGEEAKFIHRIDSVLTSMPSVNLDDKALLDVQCGRSIEIPDAQIASFAKDATTLLRAYSLDGRFTAILKQAEDSSMWRPDKVFAR